MNTQNAKSTLLILFSACFLIMTDGLAQHSEPKPHEYTFKIVQSANNTWGYDIYVDNALKIHQLNIPGMPGNEGFKTKKSATQVAELVIKKMKKGEMPPTITYEELQKVNAI